MPNFKQRVIEFIKKIPKGKVVSYGQVASVAGFPRAARQVGGILKAVDASQGDIPWWRVINNRGLITIKGNWTATKELQRALLMREGIIVGDDFVLDMEKYCWIN